MDNSQTCFTKEEVEILVELATREVKSLAGRIEMNKINPHFDAQAASRRILQLGMIVGKALRNHQDGDPP